MGSIHWTILSSPLFAAVVHSLAFPGPNPTFEVVVPLNAQSPRPTDPPAVPEILRRQNGINSTQTVIYATDNTCGFMSGRLGAALSCYSTRSCFFFPSLGLRGCCDGDDCGFAVACRDMEEASISRYCDNGCLMDTLTVKCTETSYPYCNTALYLGGITDYFCNSLNVSTPQTVETTYRGQTDRTLITTVVDLATLSTTTTTKPPSVLTESDTTTSSSSPGTPSSSSTPAPPPQSSSPTPAPQETSTPVAPIVGGVVGGVAVIGLIVLGIIFLVKKGGSKPPPPAPTPGPADPSSPIGFSATPMGGSPPPQQMQQQQTPPPVDVKYGQTEPMVQAYPAVVPPNQGYQQQPQQYQQQQQQQYSPQGSTGVGYFASSVPSQQQQQQYQQPSPTDPNNRLSTASPASPTSNSDSLQDQQQQQQQRHFSQQSFASNSTYPNIQAYQQPGAGAGQANTSYQYAPPPNVYEVGGHAVGGPPDLNADHRGQMYQLQ